MMAEMKAVLKVDLLADSTVESKVLLMAARLVEKLEIRMGTS